MSMPETLPPTVEPETGHVQRYPEDHLQMKFPSRRPEPPLAVAFEVLRGAKRFPNPLPPRNSGGDCFACATYSMVSLLFPEREDITWDALYKAWENPKFPGQLDNTWPHYLEVFDRMARLFELPVERGILFTPPFSAWDIERNEPAWFRAPGEIYWWRDLQAYLSAGWLAIAHVNQFGSGPYEVGDPAQEGYIHTTDHIVLIDGARQARVRRPQPKWYMEKYPESEPTWDTWEYQVHVVDSARSDQSGWHEARLWLYRHGASALHIMRRHYRDPPSGICFMQT